MHGLDVIIELTRASVDVNGQGFLGDYAVRIIL